MTTMMMMTMMMTTMMSQNLPEHPSWGGRPRTEVPYSWCEPTFARCSDLPPLQACAYVLMQGAYGQSRQALKDLAHFDLTQFKLSWYCRIHCRTLLMPRNNSLFATYRKIHEGGVSKFPLICYLLNLLIADLADK